MKPLAEGGIDLFLPETYDIVWSLVILVIIAAVFYKVVLPKFQAVFDERAARIEGGIAKAEQAQKEAVEAKRKYEEQLSHARVEASKIRDDARAEASHIIARRPFPRGGGCRADHHQRATHHRIATAGGHGQPEGRGRHAGHRAGRQDPGRQAAG